MEKQRIGRKLTAWDVKSLIRWLRARGSCQQNQLPETSSGQTRGEMRTQRKVKGNRYAGYLDGDEAMAPLRQARGGGGRRLDEKEAKPPPPHRLELPAFPSLVSSSPRSTDRAARRSLLGARPLLAPPFLSRHLFFLFPFFLPSERR
jgi:hypothetical protein